MATMTLAKKDEAPSVKSDFVVCVNGPMLNLFTDVWITADPKKIPLDDYVLGQIAAGKLKIVTP